MLKTVKRLWEKIHFGVYPVLRFAKFLYYALFVVGLVMCVAYTQYEKRTVSLREGLNNSLNKKWVQNVNATYLNVHFPVDELSILGIDIFTKENVQNIVGKILKMHNKTVDIRRVNEQTGFVVEPNIRYSDRVRAFYVDDVEINGKTTTTLFVISEQHIKENNWEKTLAKYELPIPK